MVISPLKARRPHNPSITLEIGDSMAHRPSSELWPWIPAFALMTT